MQTQNRWLLGLKFTQMKNEGISFLDLNKSSSGISKEVKQLFFFKLIKIMITSIAALILLNILFNIDYSDQNLREQFPQLVLPTVLFTKKKLTNLMRFCDGFNVNLDGFKEVLLDIKKQSIGVFGKNNTITNIDYVFNKCSLDALTNEMRTAYVGTIGLFLQITYLFSKQDDAAVWKANQVLLWLLIVLASYISSIEFCMLSIQVRIGINVLKP